MSQVGTETESGLWQPDWESMDVGKLGDSFYDMDQEPLSEPIRLLKLKTILRARARNDYNALLRYMRTTEGLVANDQRAHIWPALLCRDDDDDESNHLKERSASRASLFQSPEVHDVASTRDTDDVAASQGTTELENTSKPLQDSTVRSSSGYGSESEPFSKVLDSLSHGVSSKEPSNDIHQTTSNHLEKIDFTTQTDQPEHLQQQEHLQPVELSQLPGQQWNLFDTDTTTRGSGNATDPPSTPNLSKKLFSLLSQQTVIDSPDSSLTGNRRRDKLSSSYARLLLEDLSATDLPPHRDEEQVKLDINRSAAILSHLQTPAAVNESFTEILSDADIDVAKKKLQSLIIKVLRRHPSLNYYQGFHDVASVVLVVCHGSNTSERWGGPLDLAGDELAFKILESLALYHLRDFMTTDISLTSNHLLIIPCILEAADPEFFLLVKSACTMEGFDYDYKFYQAISSILTLFSHDIANFNEILMVWDFFLSYNSVLVNIYVYVALLLFYKPRIYSSLLMDRDHHDTSVDYILATKSSKKTKTKTKSKSSTLKRNENHKVGSSSKPLDKDALHSLLSPTSLFQNLVPGDLIKILNIAGTLLQKHPIESLPNYETTYNVWFGRFNRHSVLKTTSALSHSYQETTARIKKYNDLHDKDALKDWMNTQDSEICAQDQYYADLMMQLISCILDTSASPSSDKSGSLLLASSISSLSSSTAALNSKFVTTSQILSRMFFTDEVENVERNNPEKPVNKRVLNFYKISFTIGFVGVLIHFLISRNGYRWNETVRFNEHFSRHLGNVSNGMLSILWKIAKLIGVFVDDTLKEHIGYKSNGYVGLVGLGNVRNSIYRMN